MFVEEDPSLRFLMSVFQHGSLSIYAVMNFGPFFVFLIKNFGPFFKLILRCIRIKVSTDDNVIHFVF